MERIDEYRWRRVRLLATLLLVADVARVVDVVHAAGIGKKVAQLKPIGVVKG